MSGSASTLAVEGGRVKAGNLKHYPMDAVVGETIYDSNYAAVGSWRLEG